MLVVYAMDFPREANAQPIAISPILYGQNAHLPDAIGSQNWGGSFYNHVDDVGLSHAKVIRWGGNFVDRPTSGFTTTAQYLKLIDSCRANGMEPIITVPSNKSGFTATDAAAVVNTINNTYNMNVVYWIIGNEPDLYSPAYTAANIAAYIKSFSIAMKQQSPGIKIIGPECAWYNASNYAKWLGGTDNIAGSDPSTGYYYVDIISFHQYPLLNMNSTNPTRQNIIDKLRSSGGFKDNLIDLNGKLNTVNAGRSGSPLKIAITEANICYVNNINAGEMAATGLQSTNTFIAGQFWVEMMQICMEQKVEIITFWSTAEGCGTSCSGDAYNYGTSLGYIHPGSWTDHPNGKKPTYYHYQLVAGNFNGNYCAGTTTLTNVKVFGSKNASQVSVMIMNMDGSADYNSFTLDLNNTTGSVKIDAGINSQHTISIGDQTTKVFVFDLAGQMLKECTYTVTNASNKSAPSCTTYSPCSPPTATASSNGTVCQSATIQLSANTVAGATYSWVGPDGWTSSSEDPTRVAGTSMSGTYTLTITAGGCTSAPSTTTVTVPQFSYISPSGNVSACTSVLLTGTSNPGGYTYQWKKDGSNISGATGSTYTATVTGSYQLKITNGSCNAWSSPVSVTIGGSSSAPVASDNSPVCQSSTIMLYATPVSGASYYWTGPGGWSSTSQNPQRTGALVTMAGTYSVVAVVGSCTSAVATTYVDIPDFASIGVSTSTTFCSGQGRSCWLYASDGVGYSYQWVKDGSNISGATQDEYEATTSGSYQVRITRSDGCMAWSAPTTVNATSSHVATATPAGPTTVCSPGTVILCANGCNSYTYQWQKRDQFGVFQVIPGATNINYTVTTTGDYQVRTTLSGNHQWSSPVYCTINTGCRLNANSDTASTPFMTRSASLSVFPNPANDVFAVSLYGMNETEKIITVDVLDATGKLVYTRTYDGITASSFQTDVAMDRSYGNGLYIVRTTVNENVMYSRVVLSR